MEGRTPNKNPEKTPTESEDWDILEKAGNDELRGKFGRHTKEYLSSEFRERERKKEQNFDDITEKLFQAEINGTISSEERKHSEDELRQDLKEDKRKIRHEYMKWLGSTALKSLAPEPEPNDAKQAATEQDKIEAIRSAKIEAIKNAKVEAIKDAKNKATESAKAGAIEVEFNTQEELALAIARTQAEIAEKKARLREIKAARSLIAINADFTHDKKELARDYAEKELNAELAESNFIKRLWEGDLFKKYYWKKYEKAIFTGKRKVHLDGESLELDQIIEKRSHDAISRFVEGVLDDPETSRFVHRNIGKNGENGEKLEPADEKTTERVRQQIRDTIKSIEPGLNETEFIRQFREKAKQTAAESRDRKMPETTVALYDNYAEVAYRAYRLADQHESLDRVMEGFKVYNAEVRNNQRTEAHRDFADRIIEKLENSSIGLVVPAESIAIAVSAVSSLTKYGGALLGFGLGTASTLSGLRERNRLADERTRVMRTAAIGTPIAEQLHFKDMSDRKRAKYETKIGGRYYKIESAVDLFNNFYAAHKKQDTEAMLAALAEIKVRIDYSDSEQKDLIAYSSADRMGEERLALDRTIIEAEKLLFKESELVTKKQAKNNEESFKSIERVIQRRIDEEVQASDKKFNRYRLGRAALRAGKTLALGATFAEIVASISSSKVGIFEKAGLIHRQNDSDATETFLAGFIKSRNIESGYTGEIANIAQGDEVAYQKAGYDIVQTSDGFTGATTPRPENISIHDATGIKSNLRWADNSTAYADGNELGLHIDQAKGAFFTNVTGSSSLSTGEIVDVASNVARGNASLLVKIGGKTFESIPISIDQTTGQALFGQNGYISTTTGELIQIIGSNGERLFDTAQLVINDGIASDSTHLFTAIATITGDGAVGDILKTASDIVENLPTYTAVPPYPR